MAIFKETSRYYYKSVAKTRDNRTFINLRRPLNLKQDSTDSFITITQQLEKRPDLISTQAYGTSDLWWAILEFNGIKDPLTDLKSGMSLRIPTIQRVLDAIESLGN